MVKGTRSNGTDETMATAEKLVQEINRTVDLVVQDKLPGFKITDDLKEKFRVAMSAIEKGNPNAAVKSLRDMLHHLGNKIRSYIRNSPEYRFQKDLVRLESEKMPSDLLQRVERYVMSLEDFVKDNPGGFDIKEGIERYRLILEKVEEVRQEAEHRREEKENQKFEDKRKKREAADEESRRLNRIRDEKAAAARTETAQKLRAMCPDLS